MHATYIRPRDLPQLQNSTASQKRHSLQNFADSALKAAAGFWFLVAVVGQWAFLYFIVAFYGTATLQGNFQAWSKNTFLFKGYIAGDTVGNLFFAAHVLLAAFDRFWAFGCYLLPLAVLEFDLRAKESAGPSGRFAMAGGLVVLTVLMGVGIFGVATFMWRPLLEAMK
jgi:hypothetical protein